jgi:hypothetical protein
MSFHFSFKFRREPNQNNPYREASSKTETELKSDVITIQFQNPKRIDVFELLLGLWRIMTSSRGLPVRSGTNQNNSYREASSKAETDLKSDVIPLQFQIPKRTESK